MSPILFQTQSLVLFFIFLQKLWIIYATYVSSEKGKQWKKLKIKKSLFYFEINSYSVQIDHFVNFSEGRFNLVLGFVPGILI